MTDTEANSLYDLVDDATDAIGILTWQADGCTDEQRKALYGKLIEAGDALRAAAGVK